MPLPLLDKAKVARNYKRFVLNGLGGVGKSTALAVISKNPLWIDLDGRFPDKFVAKTEFAAVKPDYLEVLKYLHMVLAEARLTFDWIVFDTATKLMSLVEDYTITRDCSGSKEKYNAYGFGLKFSPQYFKEILSVVDAIQAKHGVNVAFICHSKVKAFNNPTTESYSKNVLDLPEAVAEGLKQWADYVGYAYSEVLVDKEKRKALGDANRYVSFTESPLYEAKNSSAFALPSRLPFDQLGVWADVVFGKNQALLKELEGLVVKFPEEAQAALREHMEKANVWAMGVDELTSFIEAGKKKLKG